MKPNHVVLITVALFLGSCSMWGIAPPAGAVIGGAVGAATGNPLVGGAGALAGYSAGKVAQVSAKHKTTLKALSEGDVEALVAAGLGQQKGFMDEALDTVYDFMKLCLIGIILWQFLPLAYTYFVHKKTKENGTLEKT